MTATAPSSGSKPTGQYDTKLESVTLDLEKRIQDEKDVGDDANFDATNNKKKEYAYHGAEPEANKVTIADWNGPDDPDNPHNWPLWKRVYNTVAVALLAFAVTFGSAVYTPGYPDVAKEFGVSGTVALLPLSLYILGLSFGPMLAAPISETQGRVIVYHVSTPLFILFVIGTGFSQTIAQLVVCRFFAGVLGSPVLAVGAGTNADLWPLHKRALVLSFFLTAPFLGPVLGPPVGGYATRDLGWRWTSWCLIFVSVPLWIFSLGLQETYKKIILKRRAKKLGVKPVEGPPFSALLKKLLTAILVRPMHMLFTEPIITLVSVYCAYAFAVLYTFFAGFPFIFQRIYGFDQGQSGLTFLAFGLGIVLACMTSILANRWLYMKHYRMAIAEGRDHAAPEHRLYTAMAGSFGLPVSLFICAWTARQDIYWIVPTLAAIPFGWGNLCIFVSIQYFAWRGWFSDKAKISASLYATDVYGPLNGASAMAANSFLRYLLGAAFPLFTIQMYTNLGVGWAISLFGFLSLLLLPIPWAFYKWGPKIRSRSSYDTLKA